MGKLFIAVLILALLFVPIIPMKYFWTVRYYSVVQLYMLEKSDGGCFIDTIK